VKAEKVAVEMKLRDVFATILQTSRTASRYCLGRSILRRIALATVAGLALALVQPVHAATRNFTLTVGNGQVDIGGGMKYAAWTYNGTVPGPLLRVQQGDTVNIKLDNPTGNAHGIFVGAAQIAPHHFGGDPLTAVNYSFKAEVPGVFAYHCTAIPVLDHVAGGMYGMMIVEPRHGWPSGPAQEVMIVQSEFYGLPNASGVVTGDHAKMVDARPDFVVFNGKLNNYSVDHPIPLKAHKLVRLFFLNAGPNLGSTFDVEGVIFKDVYAGGNPANLLHGLGTFSVGPGASAIFEFQIDEPGNYPFADQSRAGAYKGALGIFSAAP
jgi:nitrite reductase (NO-forming)